MSSREIIKNTDSPLEITLEVEVEDSDLALLAYQLVTETSVKFISCVKEGNIATCKANIAIEGIYKVVFNNVVSTSTFKVDDNLDDDNKVRYLVIYIIDNITNIVIKFN